MASAGRAQQTPPPRALPIRSVALIALLDLAARAAVPASLLALARQQNDVAVAAAVGVNLLAVLRGILSGRLVASTLRAGWQALVAAARRHSVTALRTRAADESAAMFVEATHRTAMTLAQVLPRLLADVLGLAGCAVAVVWLLGARWLLAGVVAVLLAAPLLIWVQRRLRAHEQRSFAALGELSLDVAALLDAAAELRAHGQEPALARTMAGRAQQMAEAMRRTHTLSSMLSLLPLGVALVAALVPLREASWLGGQLLEVAQAGVLGAAAVSFAISFVRSMEAWGRSQPQRDLFQRFVGASGRAGARPGLQAAAKPGATSKHKRGAKAGAGGWGGELRLKQVSVRYRDAAKLTPGPVSHRWKGRQGLALLGPNGAGKSSLALALLGLVELAGGSIAHDGKPLDAATRAALAGRVIYLPQSPFVAPSRSVVWHLRLVLGDGPSEEALREGLRASGLWPLLARRAKRRGSAPLELPAGELSGGEQQRMHLARAFVPRRGKARWLIILDEPEAALDAAGRRQLAERLDALAAEARVLLIAHDPAVVPASFATLRCAAEPVGDDAAGDDAAGADPAGADPAGA